MKRYFFYSITLGFAWCFVHGVINLNNFLIGMLLGPIIIRPFKTFYNFDEQLSYTNTIRRIPKQIKFLSILLIEIIKASVFVAKIILRPNLDLKPGIIAVPIRAKTDAGITAIANTITLTPGTLTIEVSDDKSTLYVHAIDLSDPKAVSESIRDDLEEYVLEAFE